MVNYGPSLSIAAEAMPSAEDGKSLRNNGKHFVSALSRAAAKFNGDSRETSEQGGLSPACAAEPGGVSPAEWANSELVRVFTEGLLMDFISYTDDTRTVQIAIQCVSHEAEQNRFQPSTISDKVGVMMKMFVQSGRDWSAAARALTSILGDSKRSTIQRWICLARDLDDEVREHINCRRKDTNQAYIVGNKFLVGKGEETRYKLSARYAAVALDRLYDKQDLGVSVTASEFAQTYCLPFKHLETWERAMVKTFGVSATGYAGFSRVVKGLQNEQGRVKLLSCVQQRIPLGGAPGSNAKNAGVEECRTIMQEMEKMKAGTATVMPTGPASSDGGAAPLDMPLGGGMSPQSEDGPAAACPPDEDDGIVSDILEVKPPVEDPVLEKARSLAQQELSHIAVFCKRDAFIADITKRLGPSHKAIVFLEAPTSKAKVIHEFLKLRDHFPGNFCLWLPVGVRLDLLAAMLALVQKVWPKRQGFVIQIGYDKQTVRTKPSYAIYMPLENNDTSVPTLLSFAGCRAKASECIRLRCNDQDCKHRGAAAACPPADEDANAEFHEDDLEFMEPEFEMEEEDDNADEEDVKESKTQEGGGKVCLNVFPFAHPIAFYERILSLVLHSIKSCAWSAV